MLSRFCPGKFGKSLELVVFTGLSSDLAEKEGFEPPVPDGTTVFKTAAIDHSAISPLQKYIFFFK
jgi:hypothetical protein